MKFSFGQIVSLATVAVIAAVSETRAQDFFRDFGPSRSSARMGAVRPSEFTYREGVATGLPPTPMEEAQRENQYNFAIGPIRFAVAAGMGLEWNDNITLSENHRESDFILRPGLDIDATWRMTELNTLRFAMGIGYAKYFEHSEFDTDGLLLSPNSEVELKFELGVFKFVVRDRLSYQEEPSDIPPLSNVAAYRRYENQIGLTVSWEANQFLTMTAGYDHYNLWTVDDEFSAEERAVDTFFFRPTSKLAPTVTVGLNVAYSFIRFDTDAREDGSALLVGPLVEWQISDATRVYAEAGLQRLTFEGESKFDNSFFAHLDPEERALFRDDDDSTSAYFRFQIANRPSDVFEQNLSASKTAEIGFGSNFYDLYQIEYNATYKGIRNTELGPTIFYQYYETSGDLNEEASRVGLMLGVRHHLTNALTLGLDYRFFWKDSNVEGMSYYQNLVFVSVHYKF
jgi:hypothetical protein